MSEIRQMATKIRWGIQFGATALVALAGAVALFQRAASHHLQTENESLRQQTSELASLLAENERLSNHVAQARGTHSGDQSRELLRLRNEVGMLRKETNGWQRLQQENQQLRANLAAKALAPANPAFAPGYQPKESWANVGYDTPENTLQTLFWAGSQGDAKTFLASLTAEQQKQIWDKETDLTEAKLGTELAKEVSKLNGYQITKTAQLAGDQTLLEVLADNETRQIKLQKVDGQWKMAEPITSVPK